MGKFWPLILIGGYLLVAVEVASSIYVNQLNATKFKSSKAQFQYQFELSLAQLSPSLSYIFFNVKLSWAELRGIIAQAPTSNCELPSLSLKGCLYYLYCPHSNWPQISYVKIYTSYFCIRCTTHFSSGGTLFLVLTPNKLGLKYQPQDSSWPSFWVTKKFLDWE